jgi:hypothetical protein
MAKASQSKLAGIPNIGPAVVEKLKDQLKKRLGQQ